MRHTAKIFAILFCFAVTLMAADLTITYSVKGNGMMGAKEGTSVTYYSSRFQRIDDNTTKRETLIDYDNLVTFIIDHNKKRIGKIKLEDVVTVMKEMEEKAKQKQELGPLAAMFGDPNNVKVEELGNEKVAGRTCKRVKITVGKLEMEICNDLSLVPPISPEAYSKMMKIQAAMAMANPVMGKVIAKLEEEVGKYKGVNLKRVQTIMGNTTTSEAIKVEQAAVPASKFQLPSGYTEEDEGKKMLEQIRKAK